MTNLFIFNTDFRVRDNPALFYAAENGESVVAMFIHNPKKWESHNESDLKIAFQIDNLKIISRKFFAISEPDYSKDILETVVIPQIKDKNTIEQFSFDKVCRSLFKSLFFSGKKP